MYRWQTDGISNNVAEINSHRNGLKPHANIRLKHSLLAIHAIMIYITRPMHFSFHPLDVSLPLGIATYIVILTITKIAVQDISVQNLKIFCIYL